MNTEMITFAKPIIAVAIAGSMTLLSTVFAQLADHMTPPIPGVPAWITGLGLPVAFLVCVIYALIATHKALRDSEKGRREDLKVYNERFERLTEKGNETREQLIRAIDNQTNEFKSLADHMKARPCQK